MSVLNAGNVLRNVSFNGMNPLGGTLLIFCRVAAPGGRRGHKTLFVFMSYRRRYSFWDSLVPTRSAGFTLLFKNVCSLFE